MTKQMLTALVILSLTTLTGCQSINNTIMEKVFKKEKRDLLKMAVESVRKGQEQSQEEFKDAMTNLKELYAFQGGDLEKMYNKLKGSYESSKSQADNVHKRINNMEDVAKSMFVEWEKEIKQYDNASMAANSRQQLNDTKARYAQLAKAVKASEETMQPVLKQLSDHVLYLKHNLNAAAIGSMKGEASNIQSQIEGLIKRMNTSIAEANAFIRTFSQN